MSGAGDYRDILEAAQDLQFFTGYLDSEDFKRKGQVQGRFDAARRALVYDLLKETTDTAQLRALVDADLERVAAAREYTDGAIEDVREALMKHVDRQAQNSPFRRFLVRWGPPVATAVAVGVYLWLRMR